MKGGNFLKDLVLDAINGNGESFAKLIKERKEKIYRIAYSYVNNQEDAMEIFQEVVYKAFSSIATLKHPEYFNTWLIRITINTSIDYFNKNKKIIPLGDEYENYQLESPTADKEDIMDLYGALNKLDFRYKTVIILRYFEDLSLQEIADILKLPLSTVKSQLYRGLEKLKIDLKEGDVIE